LVSILGAPFGQAQSNCSGWFGPVREDFVQRIVTDQIGCLEGDWDRIPTQLSLTCDWRPLRVEPGNPRTK
jgi:hypothetical protein